MAASEHVVLRDHCHWIYPLVRFGFQRTAKVGKTAGLADSRIQMGNLRSRHPGLQRAAAAILQNVPYDDNFPEAIEICLKSSDPKMRERGVMLIDKAGKERIGQHVPQLLELLNEQESRVTSAAVWAFPHTGPEVIPLLLDMLERSKGHEMTSRRNNVYGALIIGFPQAKETLAVVRKALQEEEMICRHAILFRLAQSDPEIFLQDVRNLIRHPDKKLAQRALLTLSHYGQKAKSALPDLFWAMGDKDLRRAAIAVLASRVGEGDPKVLAALGDVLAEARTPEEVATALNGIAHFGDQGKIFLDRIIPLLDDKRIVNGHEVRYLALEPLYYIGPAAKAAIPQLLAWHKEPTRPGQLIGVIRAIDPAAAESALKPLPKPKLPRLPKDVDPGKKDV